jgi:hypothetical protein
MQMLVTCKKLGHFFSQFLNQRSLPVLLLRKHYWVLDDPSIISPSTLDLRYRPQETLRTRTRTMTMSPEGGNPLDRHVGSLSSCFNKPMITRSLPLAPPLRVISSSSRQKANPKPAGLIYSTACFILTQTTLA